MAVIININADEVVSLTNKLEKMHKSFLPRTVRDTLNHTALKDTKQDTMLKSAKKSFKDERTNLGFFKATSRVKFASGWDVKNMRSEMGFVGSGNKDNAVEDLEKQEKGGTIGGRAFIPLNEARTSNSFKKRVRKKYRIADIKNKIIDAKDNKKGVNAKQKYILSAIYAGKGGFVIGTETNQKGNRHLYEIKKIGKKGGKTFVKSIPIYSVSAGRKVDISATHFMRKAGTKSAKRIQENYINFAKKQIKVVR